MKGEHYADKTQEMDIHDRICIIYLSNMYIISL